MSRSQIIHSGHFMVSEPHAESDPDPDLGSEEAISSAERAVRLGLQSCAAERVRGPGALGKAAAGKAEGAAQPGFRAPYDFDTVNEGTCQIYRYGPRSSGALNIDASLTKLFECMTLAYSGKIVSPKWKTFKGLKLLQRDKIRLNNAIWRAWYLQYVEKRQNPVCSFVTPLECSDIDQHRKPEAVIMEGKYWKRQVGVVIREYHKWRTFFHIREQKKFDKPICDPSQEVSDAVSEVEFSNETASGGPMELDPLHDLDVLLDTMVSSRNPYGGPNLRGLAHQGNADMIQPTLTQLHPNFGEEFVNTLDPIQEFITSCRPQPIFQVPAPLPDATALHQDASDLPSVASHAKELPPLGDPILDVELPTPLTGQQIFLPFFPTSPPRISPPPAPPILHLQPQTTFVFSVVTNTGLEKTLPSPSGEPFVMPNCGSSSKGGGVRQLQRIAPAPSPTHHQPATPQASFTPLPTTGPVPLALTPVTKSAQICGNSNLSADVLLRSVSITKEPSPVPVSAAALLDIGSSNQKIVKEKNLCSHQEKYKHNPVQGSCRSSFTSADCARRMIISSGFNTLASLVLSGSDQTSTKLSKALLLQKSVAYVGRLQQERRQNQEMVERLRGEIEELSTAIDKFQRQLPPSGAPVLPPQSNQASELYEEYVRQRTLEDWRFWIFSIIIKPLFESYTRMVNTGSIKDFCQSVMNWLEQHCTLPILRPAISGSLLQLSKITSILTQPSHLPGQALRAVSSPQSKSNN
ncbi:MLX-interacting protein-like isoform X1 [Crotalus tigris]|uniref:MLX-interacting protein-like isoform X1 n=1 Tax=Crotalus tigris TaxID=88082 RepID=UPI00192F6D30|nr:MLX-interacting protein-like isoform X1 [Crotalus tigris]